MYLPIIFKQDFCNQKFMKFRNSQKKPFKLEPPSKIIIDTHGGLQDILAIVFAQNLITRLGTGQQIIGITCVAGKNSLDVAVKSALVANKLLGTKIPVFKGQSQSLMLAKQYPKAYMQQKFSHIEQNLYAEVDKNLQLHNLVQKQKAVDFLINACRQHKNNLGIVSFGPVTNLGLAQRLEESLKQVKLISLSGGQLHGMGNTVHGNVQANFACDPLAADILFEIHQQRGYLKDKIYVNVLENTLSFCFKQAFNSCLDTGKLRPEIDDIFVNMMGINSIVLNCGPILTILPLIAPKCVTHQYHVFAQIVRDAEPIDGLFAINWLKSGALQGQYPNFVFIFEDYNKELITDLFMTAFVETEKIPPANL